MQLMNLTPHDITYYVGKTPSVFPKSGIVARVSQDNYPSRLSENSEFDGLALVTSKYGEGIDLPLPQDGIVFIVSAIVRSAYPDRFDLISPDSGSTAIRNEAGQIIGVTQFIANC